VDVHRGEAVALVAPRPTGVGRIGDATTLAGASPPNRGNGSPSQSAKNVSTAEAHPAIWVGAIQWYVAKPRTHATRAMRLNPPV
jgi:hypothetical protein